ncbi:MAG: DUF1592 domain-containing protein [Polyangiaceae bacterium]|nr:DUF1592 domain-containing protein [Polyangiaceae bacterium]
MTHRWLIGITGIALLGGCAGQSVLVGEEGTTLEGSGGTSNMASNASGGQLTGSGGAPSVVVTSNSGGASVTGTTGGSTSDTGGSSPFPVPQQPADILGCTGGDAVALPPAVVATRLASFIYQGAPDASLLAAANSGALSTTAGIACQARRMLGAPEAEAGVRELFRSWLGYGPTPAANARYSVDSATYLAMVEETDRFANYVFFTPASSFEDLLTAPYTFLDAALAAHYGITFPGSAQGFVHTPLRAENAGVLTQGVFLNTGGVEVSISRRGTWISNQLRCTQIPPEPPSAMPPPLDPNFSGRAQLEAQVSAPNCAGCHLLIDPMGYGLEYFDGAGRFRANDNGFFIDASGTLPNSDTPVAFLGAPELGHALSQDTSTLRCATSQVLQQALRSTARSAEVVTSGSADDSLRTMGSVFQGTGKSLKELVIAAVTTPEFLAP